MNSRIKWTLKENLICCISILISFIVCLKEVILAHTDLKMGVRLWEFINVDF